MNLKVVIKILTITASVVLAVVEILKKDGESERATAA
jgi:hypothetical protein